MKRFIVMAVLASCSAPPIVQDTSAVVDDHPNRCYRLFEAGPYRESCLAQFPTGNPYMPPVINDVDPPSEGAPGSSGL